MGSGDGSADPRQSSGVGSPCRAVRGVPHQRARRESEMLFHVTWQFIDRSEEGQRRSLAVFGTWQPPAGSEVKGFYGFADGGGGVAIIEVDNAATLARTTAPFTPWLRFTSTVILPIEEASGIGGEGIAFHDSVSEA